MGGNLNITLVQYDIAWENQGHNIKKLDKVFRQISNTDLVILPETFTTGFSMKPLHLFESMEGSTARWMRGKANELDAAITGSLIIKEGENIYNRALWVTPDGNIEYYDKRHLFSMGGEDGEFTAGAAKLIAEYKGWRICPLICYDLRFPVWSRNLDSYDLIIYMANWPSPRHHVWEKLLIARAIENQAYCIGVNRTGTDGMGVEYHGGSALVDAKGIGTFLNSQEQVKSFDISLSELQDFREKFPVLNGMDRFSII